jgi:mono/diheme cytochrome c family protein
MNFKILGLLLACSCFASCVSRNLEELNPPPTVCATDTVTYRFSIVNILTDNSCIACHNNSFGSGGVNLEGYANVKRYADNGKLYGVTSHTSGSPMPKGSDRITQSEIDKIQAWVCQGAPNN